MASATQTLVLGGGCFWCTESVFLQVRGVEQVESGYCNGHAPNPTYAMVSTGTSGHNEVVRLVYDPAQVSLQDLLEVFFLIHDPTTLNRQGHDVGTQYRSGIYCTSQEQLDAARAMVQALDASGTYAQPVVTEVQMLSNYARAEEYHQNYLVQHMTQPYIVIHDLPKLYALKKELPKLYAGK